MVARAIEETSSPRRLVEGAGIELDPAHVKPASERLAKRGYLPLIGLFVK